MKAKKIENYKSKNNTSNLKDVSQKFDDTTDKILIASEEYERKGYEIVFNYFNRVLDGFFLFRMRKASVHAGSSTYFAIMSIFPMLLLLVSLIGYIMGDIDEAKSQVLSNFKNNFPQLAPWIFKSVTNIVTKQLSGGTNLKIFNFIFLIWASIGFYNSVIVAIRDITHIESKGGMLLDDIRAIVGCMLVSVFFVILLGFSKNAFIYNFFMKQDGHVKDILITFSEIGIFQMILSMIFFTFCYKVIEKISLKDSFLGALTFVLCFFLAKAGYGIYISTIGEELKSSFGNFYTLVIALIWIYFLMYSFFLGACVAFVGNSEMIPRNIAKNIPLK